MRTISFVLITLMFSCTVQKRHHQNGYYISWTKKRLESKNIESNTTAKKNVTKPTAEIPLAENLKVNYGPGVSASAGKTTIPADLVSRRSVISFTDTACDTIVMRSGEKVTAKVLEINIKKIKYRRCDPENRQLYTVNKSEVLKINYPNATTDVMPDVTTEKTRPNYTTKTRLKERFRRKMEPAAVISFIAAVLALIALNSSFASLGGILCLVAIISGIVAIKKFLARPNSRQGIALAIVGLVAGILVAITIFTG